MEWYGSGFSTSVELLHCSLVPRSVAIVEIGSDDWLGVETGELDDSEEVLRWKADFAGPSLRQTISALLPVCDFPQANCRELSQAWALS